MEVCLNDITEAVSAQRDHRTVLDLMSRCCTSSSENTCGQYQVVMLTGRLYLLMTESTDPLRSDETTREIVGIIRSLSKIIPELSTDLHQLQAELSVLNIVNLTYTGEARRELERIKQASLQGRTTTSVVYLEEFLKQCEDKGPPPQGTVTKLVAKYQEKIERLIREICAVMERGSSEKETEREELDTISDDSPANKEGKLEDMAASITNVLEEDSKKTTNTEVDDKETQVTLIDDSLAAEATVACTTETSHLQLGLKERKSATSKVIWDGTATDALIQGINLYGEGKWKAILLHFSASFHGRVDNVALKDKWRNLVKYGHVKKNERGVWASVKS